jgi:hypothetical protein
MCSSKKGEWDESITRSPYQSVYSPLVWSEGSRLNIVGQFEFGKYRSALTSSKYEAYIEIIVYPRKSFLKITIK